MNYTAVLYIYVSQKTGRQTELKMFNIKYQVKKIESFKIAITDIMEYKLKYLYTSTNNKFIIKANFCLYF